MILFSFTIHQPPQNETVIFAVYIVHAPKPPFTQIYVQYGCDGWNCLEFECLKLH